MADARIEQGVQFLGTHFLPEQKDRGVKALSATATQAELDSFKERGIISGTWKSTAQKPEKDKPRRVVTPAGAGEDNTPEGVSRNGNPRSGEEDLLDLEKSGADNARTRTIENGEGKPAGSEQSTPLPPGFPGRATLVKADLATVEAVDEADDADLIKLGLTEATVASIRAAIT